MIGSAGASALSDPAGTSSIVSAANWVEQVLLGTSATLVAVLAVAAVGLLMLSGRVHTQRGVTVVIGCFVLFGAPVIAAGLQSMGGGGPGPPQVAMAPVEVPAVLQELPVPSDYGPYAGASVRRR